MSKKLALLVMVLTVLGCGGPAATIKYYVIDPVADVESQNIADLSGRSIQIMDLKLPQYLERFQIARRENSNQLTFATNQQWGENLRKNLYRTMTRNLSGLLGTSDVASAIDRSFSSPDYLVRLSLEAFEQGSDGRVKIAARYQISNGKGEVLATAQFDATAERDSGDNYGDMVRDLQGLFGDLSVDMAELIKRLDAQHAG